MKVNIVVGGRFQAGLVVKILSKLGHTINIYSSSPKRKWNISYKNNIKIYFVPLFSTIFSVITKLSSPMCFKEASSVLFDILSSLIMKKCDILHVWSSYGLYCIKKAKKNNSTIFVEKSCPHPYYQEKLLKEEAEILEVDFQEHSKWFLGRTIAEFELADKVIVCSNYTLNSFLDYGFSKEKLYNVALEANFEPKRTYERDFNKDELVVGMIGGSIIRKGFLYLLEAWKELDIANKKLLLKTSQTELMKVKKIWNLIDGDDTIEIIGYLDDMEDFYERCDLFVLPSIDEGFGMVVFEALGCSLPIIITKNVGAGDFITDEKEGYIIDIRSSNQIKEKIEFLYHNRDIMQQMSMQAKSTFDNYKNKSDNYNKRLAKLYYQYEKNRCV